MLPDDPIMPPDNPVPLTAAQIAMEKRRGKLALIMRLSFALLLVMAFLGGWNLMVIFGTEMRPVYRDTFDLTGAPIKEIVDYQRVVGIKGLKVAGPVGGALLIMSIAYLVLSFPARKGNRNAAQAAGIMAVILTFACAIWLVNLVMITTAMTETAESSLQKVMPIVMLVVWFFAAPWFVYMSVLGFDNGRRRRRRPTEGFEVVTIPPVPADEPGPPPLEPPPLEPEPQKQGEKAPDDFLE